MGDEKGTPGGFLEGLWARFVENEREKDEARQKLWRENLRRYPDMAEWRNLALRALGSDRVAMESYFNLRRAGISQPEPLELLVGMVAAAPRKRRRVNWLSGVGMTPKQLKYMPSRVETMADEIQRLNEHPMLMPDVWIESRGGLSDSQKKTFGKWLPRLPFLMRLYAAFLRGHSRSMGRFTRQRVSRVFPQSELLLALIWLIRKETGRPMWSDLSNVLNAAAGIAGTDQTFDPATLKQLDSRERKRTKPSVGA